MRAVAPDILLFANLGAIQFNYGFTPDDARKAVDMIGADALFRTSIHFRKPFRRRVIEAGRAFSRKSANWPGRRMCRWS